MSDIDEESIEPSQDHLESLCGINRAPWDVSSDNQQDSDQQNHQFFFFTTSPVNECFDQLQQSMNYSSLFDDNIDEITDDGWVRDDEDVIPVPFERGFADNHVDEPSQRHVSQEEFQSHIADRKSPRQIQFSFQTGLETIDEENEDDSSLSCCSFVDEPHPNLPIPESVTDCGKLANTASKDHVIDADFDNVTVESKSQGSTSLSPEQQAAYECLQALAFFLR